MEITDSYYDRDLSWLSFNRRVLMEADENSLPPYERLKFLAIYSSNLDEFFRVRVAAIRSVMTIKKSKRREWGLRPKQLMNKIQDIVGLHQEEIGRILNMEILPELAANNIVLLQERPNTRSTGHLFASISPTKYSPLCTLYCSRKAKSVIFCATGSPILR